MQYKIFKGPKPKELLTLSSRQASSNASEGGVNRESSMDDSGVVDDHDEQEIVDFSGNTFAVNVSYLY